MAQAAVASGIEPMMRSVSEYITTALDKPLPDAVVEKGQHHILDTIAAIAVGTRLKPGKVGLAVLKAQGSSDQCTVGLTAERASVVDAAFAVGMLAGAGETDDSHYLARMHPGCAIVPPILATAEQQNCSGEDFLRAVVLGYDIGCRTTMALDEALLDGAFHSPHSIGGLFGGTAGCSALRRFDAEHVRYALSYAVQQAAGVTCWMRDPEHCEKAFVFGGNPARNAANAALMVACGFTGGSDPFHGQHNFFDCYSPNPDRSEMVRGLGRDYEIMRAMIKKWTVGSPIQPAIDSTQALIQQHKLGPDDIEAIDAILPDKETKIISNRHMPEICLQHLVALMVVDGDITLESSHDYDRMKDPRVLAVREKITLVPNAEMTRTPPPRQARIEIRTRDGRTLSHHTPATRGTPDNPMTREEVDQKAIRLMTPIIGQGKTMQIVDACRNLSHIRVRDLCAIMSGADQAARAA